ncbi:MAG: DNA-deoxyinosine glycosylase [Clostridia bacterium]|nr:DNA-deoxyinosine glycosylase [Clostridia bacterium]
MKITHPFEPIYDEHSRILILGSFPSVRSRTDGFYYGHPQNRFWRLMEELYGMDVLQTTEEKKNFLLKNGIALWDVIASCEIENSSDSSIRNAVPNDLNRILKHANIRYIYTNGKTADKLYRKYFERESVCLPSTSPANAGWTFEKLIKAWGKIYFME